MEKDHLQINDPIHFYRKNEEYGYFSNFYPSPFVQNGFHYKTNEHYFQSKKFQGKQMQKEIVDAPAPNQAFRLGQTRSVPIRENWEKVKDDVMYKGLYLKFTQNKDLKQKLLATGERKIVEHTERDSYWGDGKTGKGKNMLGILLMKLRDQFKKQVK